MGLQVPIDNPGFGELVFAGTQEIAADPGSGQWRSNAGDARLDIHATTQNGASMSAVLEQMDAGGFVQVRVGGQDRLYSVQSVVSHTTWFELAVTVESSSSAFALTAGDIHSVVLILPKGAAGGGGVTDHGELTGRTDDDHPQYFNQTRGDARYFTQAQVTAALAGKSDVGHAHDDLYYTEAETDAALALKADDNDARFPSTEQKAALAGTGGVPDGLNRYVTDSDPRMTDDRHGTTASVGDHADVDITTDPVTEGETLVWRTDKFVPEPQSGGGQTNTVQGDNVGTQNTGTDVDAVIAPIFGTGPGQVAEGNHTHATLPTADQKAALDGAAAPSGANVFATMADVGAAGGGTVTSVGITPTDGLEVDSGSPVTTAGAIQLGVNAAALRTHINVEDGSVAAGAAGDAYATNHEVASPAHTAAAVSFDPALTNLASTDAQAAIAELDGDLAAHDHAGIYDPAGTAASAVGTHESTYNHANLPTADEKAALAGTGTPSAGNVYVTNDDARLSDDRTASGLRSATTIVSVSAATAPSAGQILKATSATTATWQNEATGGTPEGTDVLSTDVPQGYVLTADGDNSSSWQQPSGGTVVPRTRGVAVLTTNVPAGTLIATGVNATGSLLAYGSTAEFQDNLEVFINGDIQRNDSDATGSNNYDVYPSAVAGEQGAGSFYCEYPLPSGTVIQVLKGGGGAGNPEVAFAWGARLVATNPATWYSYSAKGWSDAVSDWNTAYGTSASDPASPVMAWTPGHIAPWDGTVDGIQLQWQATPETVTGKFRLYKITISDGSGGYTMTQVGADISIDRATATNVVYLDSQTSVGAPISAGERLMLFCTHDTNNGNGYFSCTVTLKKS